MSTANKATEASAEAYKQSSQATLLGTAAAHTAAAAAHKNAAGLMHEAGFLTFDQWHQRLSDLCEEYNARPQESKAIGGTMSPDEIAYSAAPRGAILNWASCRRIATSWRGFKSAHFHLHEVQRKGFFAILAP